MGEMFKYNDEVVLDYKSWRPVLQLLESFACQPYKCEGSGIYK